MIVECNHDLFEERGKSKEAKALSNNCAGSAFLMGHQLGVRIFIMEPT
jgi:hypothetical protein